MQLTPELLAASYRLLHCSIPFLDWNLPEAEDIVFKVTKTRKWFARFVAPRTIEVSKSSVGQLDTLIRNMGHEMIHLHLDELGYDKVGGSGLHSARFRALALEACKAHGWDYCAFF
jgi:hypothetical protein